MDNLSLSGQSVAGRYDYQTRGQPILPQLYKYMYVTLGGHCYNGVRPTVE